MAFQRRATAAYIHIVGVGCARRSSNRRAGENTAAVQCMSLWETGKKKKKKEREKKKKEKKEKQKKRNRGSNPQPTGPLCGCR